MSAVQISAESFLILVYSTAPNLNIHSPKHNLPPIRASHDDDVSNNCEVHRNTHKYPNVHSTAKRSARRFCVLHKMWEMKKKKKRMRWHFRYGFTCRAPLEKYSLLYCAAANDRPTERPIDVTEFSQVNPSPQLTGKVALLMIIWATLLVSIKELFFSLLYVSPTHFFTESDQRSDFPRNATGNTEN